MQPRWTKDEELKFIKGVSKGKTFDELALIHDRTVTALELRLKKIIYENVISGKTTDQLAKLLKIPEGKVIQYYYAYVDFREKNGKKVEKVDIDVGNTGDTKKEKSIRTKKQTIKTTDFNKKPNPTNSTNSTQREIKRAETIGELRKEIRELKKENKFLRSIMENKVMKDLIKQYYKSKGINSKTKKIISQMIKFGLL